MINSLNSNISHYRTKFGILFSLNDYNFLTENEKTECTPVYFNEPSTAEPITDVLNNSVLSTNSETPPSPFLNKSDADLIALFDFTYNNRSRGLKTLHEIIRKELSNRLEIMSNSITNSPQTDSIPQAQPTTQPEFDKEAYRDQIIEDCMNILLQQLTNVIYPQNNYPIQAVPQATILSLPAMMKISQKTTKV